MKVEEIYKKMNLVPHSIWRDARIHRNMVCGLTENDCERQSGRTTNVIAKAISKALTSKCNVVFVTYKFKNCAAASKIAVNIMKNIDNLEYISSTGINFKNGSQISFEVVSSLRSGLAFHGKEVKEENIYFDPMINDI